MLPYVVIERSNVHAWFGAGGEAILHALLVGSKGRRYAHLSMGSRGEGNLTGLNEIVALKASP